jgi:hypothetical protein
MWRVGITMGLVVLDVVEVALFMVWCTFVSKSMWRSMWRVDESMGLVVLDVVEVTLFPMIDWCTFVTWECACDD